MARARHPIIAAPPPSSAEPSVKSCEMRVKEPTTSSGDGMERLKLRRKPRVTAERILTNGPQTWLTARLTKTTMRTTSHCGSVYSVRNDSQQRGCPVDI